MKRWLVDTYRNISYEKATRETERENKRLFGEKYRIEYSGENNSKAQVLTNGPSLNKYWGLVNQENVIITVNGYFLSDSIEEIRPDYHIIVDPKYSEMPEFLEQARRALELKKIGTLVVSPSIYKEWLLKGYNSSNVLVINDLSARKDYVYEKDYNTYKNNYRAPIFMTVAIAALYLAIQIGCKDVELFGNDFDWIHNMKVDSDCNLLWTDTHFYGNKSVNFTQRDGFHLIDELKAEVMALEGYYQVQKYAKDMNVIIYNMSPDSMLDMFEKKKIDDGEYL